MSLESRTCRPARRSRRSTTQPSTTILYHGTLAVEPDGAGHSRIVYTILYDQEPLGTEEAKAAGRKQRTDRFTAALAKMKSMAEAP